MNGSKRKFHGMAGAGLILLMAAAAVLFMPTRDVCGQSDGFLTKDGRALFPIGFYELPAADAEMKAMADSGVNLVRCHNRRDLDRVAAAGALGWLPLNVQAGATDALRTAVDSVKDHPALAVWEGPDEMVWNFTAASELFKQGIHKSAGAWRKKSPEAVEYAEKRARELMPKMREGIALVRQLDPRKRQVWINEALDSDESYVRQYLDSVDITGCDLYPVRHDNRPIARLAAATERWKQVGRGKPVWMVLQAFSWSELKNYGETIAAYPTFAESRFMAYDVIAHGAKGILYWGSNYLKSQPFRESLYALTSELSALQPFLTAPDEPEVRAAVNGAKEEKEAKEGTGIRLIARRSGNDCVIVLLNEANQEQAGVAVAGLTKLNGRTLVLLYGAETAAVEHGGFVTRMPPLSVKVFATDRKWESSRRQGRDYRE